MAQQPSTRLHFALPQAQNICRSPSAEAVFRAVVERAGLASQFEIDSCGTGAPWSTAPSDHCHSLLPQRCCSLPLCPLRSRRLLRNALCRTHTLPGGGSSNWYLPGGFSYHEGDPSDPRMTAVAAKRGVTLTSRSRPLVPADLSTFDVVLGACRLC